jgi:alanyl-tRNA synthetase
MTFLAADRVLPSNEGRGYVLRRIIRRAVQQARVVGLQELWPVTDVVVDQMSRWYPELAQTSRSIQETIRAEEQRFSETLSRGLRVFEELASNEAISGDEAFTLAATYGFPVELTVELAEERGQAVDVNGYRGLMEEHREISRRKTPSEVEPRLGAARRTEFVGYETTDVLTAIVAFEQLEDGLFHAKLERSPFYPEGGGQVSDTGFIENEKTGARAELLRAIRLGDDQELVFQGEGFASGDRVRAAVPWSLRFPTMANHTATHLLHKALRDVLGDHVQQAGSAVRPDKLRFDFTHPQALTSEERAAVERLVNEKVFQNLPVLAYVTPIEEARNLGAMMLFGEKYGDEVRVIEVPGWSLELCGGTHVRSTAEIGPFVVLSESSVGAGARRIEAITSGEAFAYLVGRARELDELRSEVERLRKEKAKPATAVAEVDPEVKVVNGVNVIAQSVEGLDADALLDLSDRFKQRNAPAAVVLGSSEDGKVHLVANFDQSVADRVSASDVVRAAAALVGGGGGGRPTMARAGGSDVAKLPDALAEAERLIASALSA